MHYIIGKKYKIKPFNLNKIEAECVGHIRVKEDPTYPIFKFDFYQFGDPICYMALKSERYLAVGHSIEEMFADYHKQTEYYGNSHAVISHAGHKIPKVEFISQAREAGVQENIITESVLIGKFLGAVHANGGAIKWCSTCCCIRHTTCAACGCGECKTCHYKWVCRTDEVIQGVGMSLNRVPFVPLKLV